MLSVTIPNISPSQNTPVLPNIRRVVTRPSGASCSRKNSAKLSLATILHSPSWRFRRIAPTVGSVVVEQDPVRRAVHVVVLAGAQGPQEEAQASRTHRKAEAKQIQNDRHRSAPRCRRRLFAITSSEELDIAAAASQGVTQPATASGTITTL